MIATIIIKVSHEVNTGKTVKAHELLVNISAEEAEGTNARGRDKKEMP